MKCSECTKDATRHGTGGRAYCTAHISFANQQVGFENQSFSALCAMRSADARDEWRHAHNAGVVQKFSPRHTSRHSMD